MTTRSDIAAIVPTANARAVVMAKGFNLDSLLLQLQQQTVEMQITLKQVIALHPSGGGDAANVTALNAVLTALL
jgi:hypothetical protein